MRTFLVWFGLVFSGSSLYLVQSFELENCTAFFDYYYYYYVLQERFVSLPFFNVLISNQDVHLAFSDDFYDYNN